MTQLREIPNLPEPRAESYQRHAAPAFEERYLPGPVVNGVTYESHRITLYVARLGALKEGKKAAIAEEKAQVYMKIHHGGGIHYYAIDCHLVGTLIDSWLALDDVTLYSIIHAIWDAAQEARTTGAHLASHRLKKAFVEGRLKKRKQRGTNSYEVWVEPEPVVVPEIIDEEAA